MAEQVRKGEDPLGHHGDALFRAWVYLFVIVPSENHGALIVIEFNNGGRS